MLWVYRGSLYHSEKAMAPHSSAPARRIPWMEEPGGLQSTGSLRVGHDWATSLSLFTFTLWRRQWQPTPMSLPGESQGWEPGGLPSMGSHRAGHDWCDLAAAPALYHSPVFLFEYVNHQKLWEKYFLGLCDLESIVWPVWVFKVFISDVGLVYLRGLQELLEVVYEKQLANTSSQATSVTHWLSLWMLLCWGLALCQALGHMLGFWRQEAATVLNFNFLVVCITTENFTILFTSFILFWGGISRKTDGEAPL